MIAAPPSSAFQPYQTIAMNWRTLAEDIKSARPYMSFNRQAMVLGIEWSTFHRWLDGSDPAFCKAIPFLELHSTVCGQELTQLRLTEARRLE